MSGKYFLDRMVNILVLRFDKLLIVLLLFLSAEVSASCWNLSLVKNPLEFAINKSDIIFVGSTDTVIKKTVHSRGMEESLQEVSAVLDVGEILKGSLNSEVTVKGKASIDCQCVYDFKVGVEYLVLASQSKRGYLLHWCDYIQPVADDSSLKEELRHMIEELE